MEGDNIFIQLRRATACGRVVNAVLEHIWILRKLEPLDLDKNTFNLKLSQSLEAMRAFGEVRAFFIETCLKERTVTVHFTRDPGIKTEKVVIPWVPIR